MVILVPGIYKLNGIIIDENCATVVQSLQCACIILVPFFSVIARFMGCSLQVPADCRKKPPNIAGKHGTLAGGRLSS